MDAKAQQGPVIELKLPETGFTVVMGKSLTIGQSRELQRIMLTGAKFNTEQGKFDEVPVNTVFDMQDESARMLIREIRDTAGTVLPYSKEWLDNLPIADGNLVYEKLTELTQASQLSDEDKKK